MVADPLDGATVVVVAAVVGVVVAEEAEVPAELPLLAELLVALVVDFELDALVLDWLAVLAALVVVPPACAASPAKTPVPVSAPASDHRVSFLIRCRPASRAFRVLGSAWWFMPSMVRRRPQRRLRAR
jgi:hypothetical protein